MLPSSFLFLLTVFHSNCNPLEVIIIFEIFSVRLQNDGSFDVTGIVNLEWNSTLGKLPNVYVDHLLGEKRAADSTDDLPESMKRNRYFTQITSFCEGTDFSKYPWDSHACQLRFLSTQNSSKIMFLPHLIMDSPKKRRDIWDLENSKSFVQWLQSGEQNFEMGIYELHMTRNPGSLVAVFWVAFVLNVLSIFSHFPFLTETAQPSRHIGCLVVVIQALICLELSISAPTSLAWPNSVKGTFLFFTLSAIVCILSSLMPPLSLHFHLVPYEAHPAPCDVPIPADHFSLDSERTRLSAALDSARLDSSRTRRSENVELCMAELKYTLASLNETMNAKSTAAWRRKLWTNGYGRVETALAVILHGVNTIFLLISLH